MGKHVDMLSYKLNSNIILLSVVSMNVFRDVPISAYYALLHSPLN